MDVDFCIFCLSFACDGVLGKKLMIWWGQGVDCQELLGGLVKQRLNAVRGSWIPPVCGSSVLFAGRPHNGRAVS